VSKKRHKHQQNKENAHGPEQPSDHCEIQWPSIYPVRIEQTAEDASRYSNEQKHRTRQLRVAVILNFITLGTAAVGFFGLLYLHGQLNQMTVSNEISKESLVSVQRAFVVFIGAVYGTKISDDSGKHAVAMRLNAPWQNSGNTATKDAISQVNWISLPQGLPGNFTYPDIGNIPKSQFALGPKVMGNTTMFVPIDYFQAALQKKTRLFVYGWFTYRDIFSGTPTRLSEFCDEIINVKSDAPMSNAKANASWDVSLCPAHNYYDEQCEDYQSHAK
jgi:hypothetical protein